MLKWIPKPYRSTVLGWIVLGLLFVAGLWTLHPTYTEICEETQNSEGKQCATYHMALGFWFHLGKFFDDHEGAITAFFTIILAASTILLWWSTRRLWQATTDADKARARDIKILQRAYITVQPGGIEPFKSGDPILSCDVVFVNSGNLPATKISWRMKRCFRKESDWVPPPITDRGWDGGTNVIPAKGRMRKGAEGIGFPDFDLFLKDGEPNKCWLYAWGTIRYRDGFTNDRFTDFCHRYNAKGQNNRVIPPSSGRQHEHGNRTDES